MARPLTLDERRAVRRLQKLAKIWPPSLKLFVVMDADLPPGADAELARISGIPNDGGDP